MHTDDKIVMMANQIASFFAAQGESRAVPAIADHIQKFWDPAMRGKFLSIAAGAELHPLVRKAVPLIH
jgi:formate dehydrogenase subunit delta